MGWHTISTMVLKHKYTNVLYSVHRLGYRYYCRYKSKGKGLVYIKSIPKEIIDSLLIRYKLSPIDIDADHEIIDCVAIIKFPEWEERCSNIVCTHGGIRLFHYYTIAIKKEGKVFQRPLCHYFDNDINGTLLAPIELGSKDIIHTILTSDLKSAIIKFNDDEINYWKMRMT